jgi:hypothetical protein
MSHEQEIGINEALAGLRRELSEAQESGQVLKSAGGAAKLCLKEIEVCLKDRHVGKKALGVVLAPIMAALSPIAIGGSALGAAFNKEAKKKTE